MYPEKKESLMNKRKIILFLLTAVMILIPSFSYAAPEGDINENELYENAVEILASSLNDGQDLYVDQDTVIVLDTNKTIGNVYTNTNLLGVKDGSDKTLVLNSLSGTSGMLAVTGANVSVENGLAFTDIDQENLPSIYINDGNLTVSADEAAESEATAVSAAGPIYVTNGKMSVSTKNTAATNFASGIEAQWISVLPGGVLNVSVKDNAATTQRAINASVTTVKENGILNAYTDKGDAISAWQTFSAAGTVTAKTSDGIGLVGGDMFITGEVSVTGSEAAAKFSGTRTIDDSLAVFEPSGIKWTDEGYITDLQDVPAKTLMVRNSEAKNLDEATITGLAAEYAYTGSAVKPTPTIKDGEKILTKDIDYELSYEDNINTGTATVIATGKNNYAGSVQATFTIVQPVYSLDGVPQPGELTSFSSNGVYKLLQDIDLPASGFTFGNGVSTVTLDLNGHNLNIPTNDSPAINIDQSNITFTITGEGIITDTGNGDSIISISGDNCTVTVEEGVELVGNTAISLKQGASNADVTFGGTATTQNVGIYVNGNITQEGNEISVTGNVTSANAPGIYSAGIADWTVTGSVTGTTGVEIRAGNLTVGPGSYISSNANDFDIASNPNGPTSTGAGITVAPHTTKLPINVTVNAGNISGPTAFVEANVEDNDDISGVNISIKNGEFTGTIRSENMTEFISGGTFHSYVDSTFIVQGKTAIYNSEDDTYVIQEGACLAYVDGVACTSAAEIMSTVTLMSQVEVMSPINLTFPALYDKVLVWNKSAESININGYNLYPLSSVYVGTAIANAQLEEAREIARLLQEQNDALLAERNALQEALDTAKSDLSSARAAYRALQAEKAASDAALESANQALAQTQERVTQLEGQIEDKDNEITTLNTEKAELAAEIETKEAEIEQKNGVIEGLNNDLEEAEEKYGQLQNEYNALEESATATQAELNFVKSNIESLEDTIESQQAQITAAGETIEALAAEKAELQTAITEKDSTIATLTEDKELLESDLATATAENTTLTQRVETLEATIQIKDARIGELTTEKENLESQITDLESTVETMTTQIESAQGTIDTLSQTISTMEASITALNTSNAALTASLEEKEAALTDAQTAYNLLLAEKNSITEELETAQGTIETLGTEKAALQEDLQEAQAAYEELLASAGATAEDLAEAKATITRLNGEIAEKDAAIEQANAQVTQLTASLTQVNTALEEKTAALNTKTQELDTTNAALVSANQIIENLNAQKSELQNSIDALQDQLDTANSLKEQAEAQLATAQAALDQAITDYSELESQRDELQAELTTAQSELAEANAEVTRLEGELTTANQTIDTLNTEKTELQSQVDTLTEQAEGYQTTITGLEASLEEANQNYETLSEQYADLEARSASALEDVEEARAARDQAEAEKDAIAAELAEAQASLQEAEDEITDLNNQLTEKDAKLQQAERDKATLQQNLNLANQTAELATSAKIAAENALALRDKELSVAKARIAELEKQASQGSAPAVVAPAKVSVKSIKVGKRKVTIKVKNPKGVYYQYAVKKKGTSSWVIYNSASTKKTISKLKSKKKYQIKVRAYTLSNGTAVYGEWSKTYTKKIR